MCVDVFIYLQIVFSKRLVINDYETIKKDKIN